MDRWIRCPGWKVARPPDASDGGSRTSSRPARFGSSWMKVSPSARGPWSRSDGLVAGRLRTSARSSRVVKPSTELGQAHCLCEQSKSRGALPFAQRAVEAIPYAAGAWGNLAAALMPAGQRDHLRAALVRAVDLDPEDSINQHLLANLDSGFGGLPQHQETALRGANRARECGRIVNIRPSSLPSWPRPKPTASRPRPSAPSFLTPRSRSSAPYFAPRSSIAWIT